MDKFIANIKNLDQIYENMEELHPFIKNYFSNIEAIEEFRAKLNKISFNLHSVSYELSKHSRNEFNISSIKPDFTYDKYYIYSEDDELYAMEKNKPELAKHLTQFTPQQILGMKLCSNLNFINVR